MLELEDAETGETLFFDASSTQDRELYAQAAGNELAGEQESFNRAKVDLIDVRCDEHAETADGVFPQPQAETGVIL